VSARLHDLIFAVGAAVLFLAMLPAVWRRAVMPLSTCVVTGAVVFAFALNYATMAYWYATAMEFGNFACWAYLLWVALRARARDGAAMVCGERTEPSEGSPASPAQDALTAVGG
jgi:hypothetical protein